MNILKYITSRKYRMFLKKLRAAQDSIWDLEFKVTKARHMRERVRQDRDRAVEAALAINATLQTETDEEKKKGLEAELKVLGDLKMTYEDQMKMIDVQISGSPATAEQEAQHGIMDTIAGLAELRLMYKDYIKTQI